MIHEKGEGSLMGHFHEMCTTCLIYWEFEMTHLIHIELVDIAICYHSEVENIKQYLFLDKSIAEIQHYKPK